MRLKIFSLNHKFFSLSEPAAFEDSRKNQFSPISLRFVVSLKGTGEILGIFAHLLVERYKSFNVLLKAKPLSGFLMIGVFNPFLKSGGGQAR